MAVAWPKTVKTHNLPRLIWAAKNSRGANFLHLSHFPRYTSFTASQPRKKGRCLAKNSENTQIATFKLGCKKFARREFFHLNHFPRYTSFTASKQRKIGRCLAKNSENKQLATFTLGCKKFGRRDFFSSQPFPTVHIFYGVLATQKWPLPGQKQSKHTICHVLFGLQKIRAARTFFISAISHVTGLLRRPNHAKMAVAWPKTVKTNKLPRLSWAAKNSRGASSFILAIFHVTRLLRRPNNAKTAVAWSKTVKTHNLPRLIWAARSSRGTIFFHPSHFAR